MLTRDEQQQVGEETVEVYREMELDLLKAITATLMNNDVTDPYRIAVGGIELRRKCNRIKEAYQPRIEAAIKRDMEAAFLLSAAREVERADQ